MKYAAIDRETARICADSIAQNITIIQHDLAKAEKLELSEITVMLCRYFKKQIKELKQIEQNLLNFSRSFDFDKTYYNDKLRPVLKTDIRALMEKKAA